MSEDKLYNNADDLLRARFDGAAETPSDFVWENIDQKLDEPKKKRGFWFLLTLLLLLLIASFVGLYMNAGKINNNKPTIVEHTNIKEDSNTINKQNADKKINKKKEEATINLIEENVLKQIKDTNTIAKNVLPKQITTAQKTSNATNKDVESIQINLLSKNNKNIVKSSLTKKPFTNNKYQKKVENNNAFVAAKSYTDIGKIKKHFELQVNTTAAENIDIIDVNANNSISSLVVTNKPIIADTVAIVRIDTTIKITYTTNKKTAEAAKKKIKKQLDKYLIFYLTPNVPNNSFASSNTPYDFLNEKGKLSFSMGAGYLFSISKKFSVNTGIAYNCLKFYMNNTPLTFNRFITQPYIFHTAMGDIAVDAATMKDGFSPASPTFPTQFKINYNYEYSFNYITVPVQLQYNLIDSKIKLSITSGITTQFLIKQNAALSLVKEKITNTISYNNFNVNKTIFAGSLGLNIQFPSKNKWHFFIAPSSKFLLTSLNKTALVNSKTSLFELNIGAALKL